MGGHTVWLDLHHSVNCLVSCMGFFQVGYVIPQPMPESVHF